MKPEELETKAAAEREKQAKFVATIACCASAGCQLPGTLTTTTDFFKQKVKEAGAADKVRVVPTGCMGLCSKGPIARVQTAGQPDQLFVELNADLGGKMVADYVKPVAEKAAPKPDAELAKHILPASDPFFAKQTKVVLKNMETLNAESLDDYILAGGYQAVRKALTRMTPEQVVAEIKASGLRGRGGAGFSTGLKWELTAKVKGDVKYVICNADEGDPGAFMDRGVLEGDPHAVLEGMIIGAYAMNSTNGILYIRAEYPLAVERVERAIRAAKAAGLLGKGILGTAFNFDCEVRLGAGAFVCGEETALIASCEGKRGTPRPRPPYPATKGVWDKPTCINNVETLANIAPIITRGAEWFAAMGTEKSKGTKVFALTGKVKNNGLVEVPMGTPIKTIVYDIGGGTANGRKVKAIQTGGPSGGMIPAQYFDTPVSYEHLQQLGSIMGSGGMIVLDEDDSIVDLTRFYLEFTVDESCGKCAPCRIGGRQLLTIVDKIAKGDGTRKDIETAKKICRAMQRASLCGLGQTAPNPVLSALKYFMHEFEARLKDGKAAPAPASVTK
ncbi:MAG: SLBB domain-containing protein [Planctomycetes bacterium]|nr:SLBB domain-containing protein [Planctomycetota bacterium]